MRLGRVEIKYGYTVDLDNKQMVEEAEDCLWEDLTTSFKFDEINEMIKKYEDSSLKEEDIPSFLLEPYME